MNQPPDPAAGIAFTITGKEIWEALQEVKEGVGGLRETVAGIPEDIRDVRAEVRNLRSDVDSLKTWRAALSGALILLSTLVGYGLLNLTNLGGDTWPSTRRP